MSIVKFGNFDNLKLVRAASKLVTACHFFLHAGIFISDT